MKHLIIAAAFIVAFGIGVVLTQPTSSSSSGSVTLGDPPNTTAPKIYQGENAKVEVPKKNPTITIGVPQP